MRLVFAPIVICLALEVCPAASPNLVPYSKQWDVKLQSLPPSEVLGKLDLDRPGLERVKASVQKGDRGQALTELLAYYRGKYPPSIVSRDKPSQRFPAADGICRHVFQWGPYKPVDYGKDVDWTLDPVNDIEWVAAMYRFYWAGDLTRAYAATGDDKYARAFVELTTDWIAKHPLGDWTRTHPTLVRWKGFAWLDLQTGIRATAAADAFKAMLHSDAVTPEFLGVLLASLYDHQVKTERVPMGQVHNKAIFEQRGVLSVCHAFPEFADAPRWAKLALERASENLLAQTTEEGVQREWCGSYHRAVLNDAIDMMSKASDLGLRVPDDFRERVRGMCDYLFAVATPDLAWPMFGDTGRPEPTAEDPRGAQLSPHLLRFSELWHDPKYAARVNFDESALPKQTSYAFESAGVYVMRSDWGSDAVYLALHCAPPALSGHDQPDNGTFELYAYGRWLLTDSGFYTYGRDKEARAWHRQTQAHQTLTLDGKDSTTNGRLRLWQVSPEMETLVVENPSYEGLVHRRTVWFVGKQFYVFLDEAIGQAPGELRVHWTPAPGPGRTSPDRTSFTTQFPDANVLIQTAGPEAGQLEEQDGWFAWDYGQRKPRTALSVKSPDAAPAAFLTVVAPYRGTTRPEIEASLVGNLEVGGDEAHVSVRAFGKHWQIGRSLKKRAAWCKAVAASPDATSRPASNGNTGSSLSTCPAAQRSVVGFERLAAPESRHREDEFPAIGTDGDGNTWISWVGFDGDSDAVLAATLGEGKASSPIVLSEAAGDHWRPAMCRDGQGRLWVTWAQGDRGKWDIYGRFLAADASRSGTGNWSNTIRLTLGEGNDFAQKLAVDRAGTLWMTWQSVVDGNYEILLAPVAADGGGKPLNVSRHPASDWEPAIATTRDGRICVAWDSYRAGSYDILLAELKDGQLSEPIGIATSPAYEAHAAIAADREDRLWIAWDNGGVRWGEDNEEGRKLHSERSVEVRCLVDGQLFEPAEPLSAALAGARTLAGKPQVAQLAVFCELPELTVDGEGRLWLLVRHLTDLTPKHEPGKHVQARGIWNPYALCYDGGRWSSPQPLPDSSGRNDMRVCTCLDGNGRVWAAWADDGRKANRAEEPQQHSVHAVRLVAPGPAQADLAIRTAGETPRLLPGPERPWSKPAHHKMAVGGQEYLLLYGDTHRHTDLSRCGMNFDGSLMDTYRYAIDVANLDFLAISDHDQDILKHRYGRQTGRLQHYDWWRSEKYCDLFYIERTFVPIYAYEHGGSFAQRGGHKNVLYLERGQPCYEVDSPQNLFKALEGKEAVAIPHQLADGPSATDWSKWNSEFERVAEIFQARGSYEFKGASPRVGVSRDGNYLWDALSMGVRIGVIASSDHGMVHSAYAGVYSSELSRAGVMEGLKSRRTFGSMDRMVIEFRLGDHPLGEEVQIEGPPAFTVLIEAPRKLRTIQVVKNAAVVHTLSPGSLASHFEFVDDDLPPGQEAWYYVRCEQENDRYGWSSPIWVKRTPAGGLRH